jgi:DNA-binding NarL/FixJ family response regulator
MPALPTRLANDTRLKVLLADDHLEILERTKALLGSGYQVVAAVEDGLKALVAAKKFDPDLILLDVEMPQMDGFRAAKEIRGLGLRAKILFLTAYEDHDYLVAARLYGDGFVLKSRMASDLLHAIAEAFSGHFFVSRRSR